MSGNEKRSVTAKALAGVAIICTLGLGHASAQNWQPAQNWHPMSYINPGTTVQVRTTQPIDTSNVDGRVFTALVERDVRDADGRIAIPRGATAELITRRGPNSELYLDLESIDVNGQRYGVDATRHPVGNGGIDVRNSGIGNNQDTIDHVGGGALLGTVIGAITGGAKGAAIGAATGAAVGAGTQVLTHGRQVWVPSESLITYRLQSGLDLGVPDNGYDRNGVHYHHYPGEPGYNGY
jgi:hypothetical protein